MNLACWQTQLFRIIKVIVSHMRNGQLSGLTPKWSGRKMDRWYCLLYNRWKWMDGRVVVNRSSISHLLASCKELIFNVGDTCVGKKLLLTIDQVKLNMRHLQQMLSGSCPHNVFFFLVSSSFFFQSFLTKWEHLFKSAPPLLRSALSWKYLNYLQKRWCHHSSFFSDKQLYIRWGTTCDLSTRFQKKKGETCSVRVCLSWALADRKLNGKPNTEFCWWMLCFYQSTSNKLVVFCSQPSASVTLSIELMSELKCDISFSLHEHFPVLHNDLPALSCHPVID